MTLPFLIIILGLIIRLVYAAYSHDFWFDEAFTYFISENSPQDKIRATSYDNWPPLYYLLMHFWQKLGSSVFFLRLPSIVFGTLTLIVVYKIAKKLFNKKIATSALILATVSPPLVYFSAENRGYALFTLLSMLTIYFYIKLSEQRSRTKFGMTVGLFVLSATLAFYTHYFAALLLISLPIASFITKAFQFKFKNLLLAYLLILILISPWLLYTLGNTRPDCLCLTSVNGLIASFLFLQIGGAGVITLKQFFATNTPILLRLFLLAFVTITSFFAVKSLRLAKKNYSWLLLLLILPLVAIFFASFYKPLFSPRSFIYLAPIFLLIISSGLSKNALRLIFVGSILVILMTMQKPVFNHEPQKELTVYLSKLPQDTPIVHANLYTYLPSRFYEPSLNQSVLAPDLPKPLVESLRLNTSQENRFPRSYDRGSLILAHPAFAGFAQNKNLTLVYAIDRFDKRTLDRIETDLYNQYSLTKEINLQNIRVLNFSK